MVQVSECEDGGMEKTSGGVVCQHVHTSVLASPGGSVE